MYGLFFDLCEICLYQAHQNHHQSHHQPFISKAQQWLRWVMPLAVRFDRQVNSTERQTKIRQLQAECEAVLKNTPN